MILSFLADENISPETAAHIESLGYHCHSLRRDGPWQLGDREIVALARQEGHIIVTHDLDFGEIYYSMQQGQVGILVLRLRRQTVEAVNRVLDRFLQSDDLDSVQIQHSLVVLSEGQYRIFEGTRGAL